MRVCRGGRRAGGCAPTQAGPTPLVRAHPRPPAPRSLPTAPRRAAAAAARSQGTGWRPPLQARPRRTRGIRVATRSNSRGRGTPLPQPGQRRARPPHRTCGDVNKVDTAVGARRHQALAAAAAAAAAAGQQAAGQQRRVELQVLQAGALPHVLHGRRSGGEAGGWRRHARSSGAAMCGTRPAAACCRAGPRSIPQHAAAPGAPS